MLRQVRLPNGVIEGVACGDPRITLFKGVPYAKAPVGELRWRSPEAYEECWEGVRRMDTFPPMCVQGQPGSDPDEFWTKELNPTATEYPMSEDCLYLNIWSPAKSTEDRLPVFLWIHGGGMQSGYSYEMEFDGESVAKEGVIMITVGYRLNIFGWMAHPELTAEDPDGPRGNYCLEDLIFSLRWIRDNIAAFGGDPGRVTIGGQSGGAGAVISLISSPLTEGLITGAISQSGGGLRAFGYGSDCNTIEEAEETGIEILKLLGVSSIEEARKLPAEEIYAAYRKLGGGFARWAPRIDGVLLTESTLDTLIHNRHQKIPYMLGNTRDEGMGGPAAAPLPESLDEFRRTLQQFVGDRAEAFMERFHIETLEDARAICRTDAFNPRLIAARAYLQAPANRERSADYCYQFSHDIPGGDNVGAFHGSDLWFMFNSLKRCWRPFTGKHYDLARQVVAYWTNFVKTGDPNGCDHNGEVLPEWKPCSGADSFIMEFTDVPGQMKTPLSEAAQFRIDAQFEDYRAKHGEL